MLRGRFPALLIVTLLAILGSLGVPRPVQAYLDPGLGSMVWQLLVAGFLAVSYVVGRYWKTIIKWFRKSSTEESDDDEESK